MVRRHRDDVAARADRPLERVEEAADLPVEAADRVEVLGRLVPVAVRHNVLGREAEEQEVARAVAAEAQAVVAEDVDCEVRQELVEEWAHVEGGEVATVGEGEIVVEAQPVRRDLEIEEAGRGLWQGV